jgi:hypothetical protein
MPITTEALINIINDGNVGVCNCSRSSNSYGDFLFIGLHHIKDDTYESYYGAGYHEYRERYLNNSWKSYPTTRDIISYMEKRDVIITVKLNDLEALKGQYSLHEQSENAVLFEELDDMMDDEDCVLCEMQDRGLL